MGGEVCTAVDMREEMGGKEDVAVVADETDDDDKVKVDDVEDNGTGIESNH